MGRIAYCAGLPRWLRGVVVTTPLAVLFAGAAHAATLAGTAHYGGSLFPVSSAHPIAILISNQPDLGGDQIVANIQTNDGPFSVNLSPGTYYVAVFLDFLDVGVPVVGAPYQIYAQRYTLPADPLAVPAAGVSGLALSFDDEHLLSGILGTVSYTGHLGQVSRNSRLEVFAYRDPDLTMASGIEGTSKTNGGLYEIVTLDTNSYYLLAFLDLNGNLMPDTGEPFEIYNGKGAPPGDAVMASPTQTSINFSFGDEHLLPVPTSGATSTPAPSETATSTPTPTATRAGTPLPTATPGPCVGDCNGDGQLSISELVKGVNIALGALPVSSCPAFDCGHTGQVTVSCLVKAVNAALNGCRQA
jgi:hypothetical protein